MAIFILDFLMLSISCFFCILFIQSGFDKVLNWDEELKWVKSHFSKTIFNSSVPTLLFTLMLMEVISGIFFALNIINYFLYINNLIPFLSFILSTFTLLALFLGQRIAKDYEGAVSIAIYFGINILGLFAIFSSFFF